MILYLFGFIPLRRRMQRMRAQIKPGDRVTFRCRGRLVPNAVGAIQTQLVEYVPPRAEWVVVQQDSAVLYHDIFDWTPS